MVIAALHEIAFLNFDHLRLRHQIFDQVSPSSGLNADLPLRLVILAEDRHDPRFGAMIALVLGLAGFEQFGNARQTTGNVAGLGRFTADAGENVARLSPSAPSSTESIAPTASM